MQKVVFQTFGFLQHLKEGSSWQIRFDLLVYKDIVLITNTAGDPHCVSSCCFRQSSPVPVLFSEICFNTKLCDSSVFSH